MQIEIENLCKSFGSQKQVLQNISLSINEGEVVSILGPSGCGKSTLLRIIAGLEEKDAGCARLNASMSYVFQQPLLLEWRTALDNVRLPLEFTKMPKGEAAQAARERLRLVGLEDSAGDFPEQLSGGMKMRVSLARALVTGPDILLLDEPLAALDEMTREVLNEELLEMNRQEGLTMLLVTHNIFEAVFMSDRIIILGGTPAGVVAEIDVWLPRPREIGVRGSAEFAHTVGQVQDSLRKQL